MKPQHVTTHEHYFAYYDGDPQCSGERHETDDISGRYDAYETVDDVTGVWSPKTDQHWETKSFAEARRLARALASEYAALNP